MPHVPPGRRSLSSGVQLDAEHGYEDAPLLRSREVKGNLHDQRLSSDGGDKDDLHSLEASCRQTVNRQQGKSRVVTANVGNTAPC